MLSRQLDSINSVKSVDLEYFANNDVRRKTHPHTLVVF